MQQNRRLQLPVIASLSIRNLKRHKTRTCLSVVGIIIGIFALCFIGMSGAAFTENVGEMADKDANIILISSAAEPNSILTTRYTSHIPTLSEEDVAEIEHAVKVVTQDYELSPVAYVVKSVTADRDTLSSTYLFGDKKHLDVVAGGLLKEGHMPRMATDVIILTSVADKYKLRLGSHLKTETANEEIVTLTVTGIIDNTLVSKIFELILSEDIILAPKELYELLNGNKVIESGTEKNIIPENSIAEQNVMLSSADNDIIYNYAMIRLANPDMREQVKASIEREMNGNGRNTGDDRVIVQDLVVFLGDLINAFSMAVMLGLGMSMIALMVSSISIANVMIIAVKERKHEIGVMRSIGTTRKQITLIFLFEAAAMGIFGSLIGVILSCIFVPLLLMVLVQSVAYFFLPSVLVYIPIGFFVGIAVCVLSGLYPAVKAARLSPIEAMDR